MVRRSILSVALVALALAAGTLYAGVRGRQRGAPAQQQQRVAASTAAAMPAMAMSHEGGHAAHNAGPFDWGAVSDHDLDVASIFLTARRAGVAAALDSLDTLLVRVPAMRWQGHVVAHALGRFAVARAGGDPKVYAECRKDFEAGCWHGVMEGYFTSKRAADAKAVEPRALDALCPAIVAPGAARLAALECAHGMGHGLTARASNDYRAALRACDALSDAESRGECHDGVFMEVTVRGTEPRPGTNDGALLRRGDLRFPCDSVGGAYEPSCWEYQSIVVEDFTKDVERTARTCDEAPPASVAACYHGFGKQATGWYGDDDKSVLAACGLSAAPFVGACVSGAAESYIDETWNPARALALCRQSPAAAKGACYGMVGARMALVRPTPADVARDCAGAEPAFVSVCRSGAEREFQSRGVPSA